MKKYKILYVPEAVREIKEASKWYNKQQKNLGKRFKDELKKEINKLKQNPFSHSVRYDDVRLAKPKAFPYAAHYTIDDESKAITIQAVLAYKQDPDTNWKKIV